MATINQQLHGSATHKPGLDPACPVCAPKLNAKTEALARVLSDEQSSLIGEALYNLLAVKRSALEVVNADLDARKAPMRFEPHDFAIPEIMELIEIVSGPCEDPTWEEHEAHKAAGDFKATCQYCAKLCATA